MLLKLFKLFIEVDTLKNNLYYKIHQKEQLNKQNRVIK